MVLKYVPMELRVYLEGITDDNVAQLRKEAVEKVDIVMHELSQDICTLVDTREMYDYKTTGVMPEEVPQLSETVVNLQPFGTISVWVQLQTAYKLGVALKANGANKTLQEAFDLEINSLPTSRALFHADVDAGFFKSTTKSIPSYRPLPPPEMRPKPPPETHIRLSGYGGDRQTVHTKEHIVNTFNNARMQVNETLNDDVRLRDNLIAAVELFMSIAIRLSKLPPSLPPGETSRKRSRPFE